MMKRTLTVTAVALASTLLAAGAASAAPASSSAHGPDDGGLEALTQPVVQGVANPLTTGVGRGVAGAAGGTQQTADLLGEAIDALMHTLGGVAANTEQGTGVAVANAAPAVQDTVHALQHNHGLAGDVVNIIGG